MRIAHFEIWEKFCFLFLIFQPIFTILSTFWHWFNNFSISGISFSEILNNCNNNRYLLKYYFEKNAVFYQFSFHFYCLWNLFTLSREYLRFPSEKFGYGRILLGRNVRWTCCLSLKSNENNFFKKMNKIIFLMIGKCNSSKPEQFSKILIFCPIPQVKELLKHKFQQKIIFKKR